MAGDDLPEGVDQKQLQRILRRVLEAEKEKLHMGNPMGINDDLESIIEEEVE